MRRQMPQVKAPSSYSVSIVEVDEIQRNLKIIERVLQEEKSFLDSSYSLSDLAGETDIPRHRLSATINEGLNMNFNELINRHRIQYVVEDLPPGKWKCLSVEGVGMECGLMRIGGLEM